MAEPDAGATVPSPLLEVHEGLGARIVPFAGWRMPLEYEGTLAEHRAVREEVGVFDVSHLGTVWITGSDAQATVAATFTNDPASLSDGDSQYTLCCDDDGGIVDDLIVYRLSAERFLAVPNAANTAAVVHMLQASAEGRDAEVDDASRDWAMLAVQGPRSLDLVGEHFPGAVARVDHHQIGRLDDDQGWLARTGYTGEIGVEILTASAPAADLFEALVAAGASPCGLGARDTLRLEMGYPLHGNDLSRDTDPYEARLGWAVKLDRGEFRGRAALTERRQHGPHRRLWGLRAADRGIPRPGMEVRHDGDVVGRVTSGTFSPSLRVGIGLSYLSQGTGPGSEVTVDIRGRVRPFLVVKPPFIQRGPAGG